MGNERSLGALAHLTRVLRLGASAEMDARRTTHGQFETTRRRS